MYNPAGIGCRENCMLKEAYSMNTLFDSVEVLDTKKEIQKENVSYEHAGYQIRVHFNGEKTLIQCTLMAIKRYHNVFRIWQNEKLQVDFL